MVKKAALLLRGSRSAVYIKSRSRERRLQLDTAEREKAVEGGCFCREIFYIKIFVTLYKRYIIRLPTLFNL